MTTTISGNVDVTRRRIEVETGDGGRAREGETTEEMKGEAGWTCWLKF